MKSDLPLSLKIVAWLFVFSGILSVCEVLLALSRSNFNINFGVLNIFAGIGLLKLSGGWRIFSLVMIWLSLILIPVATILLMSVSGPLDLNFFGQKVGDVSKTYVLAFIVSSYALVIWQYRVLIRPDVKQLFMHKANPEPDVER